MAAVKEKAELQKQFEVAAKSDTTATAGSVLSVSMERFCQDLFDRKVTKDGEPTTQTLWEVRASEEEFRLRIREQELEKV